MTPEVTLPALTSRLSALHPSTAIARSRRRLGKGLTGASIPLKGDSIMNDVVRRPGALAGPGWSFFNLRSLSFAFSFSLVLAAAPARAGEHDRDRSRPGVACADLINFTSEGATTVTAATLVTSGTVVTPAGATFSNLPAFCRVQGVSKPSTDSNILFEAWLPASTWNGKFLSAGEGGYVGTIGYASIALNLQKGYATVSTDTGHVASDTWWAVGHPEKARDYLYRAKHLVTIATKGLIKTHYGRAASRNYFQSCSNGGRQALIEIQRYPDDFDGLIVGAPWNFQSHSNAGFVWDAQALSAPGAAIRPAQLPAITKAALDACDGNDGLVDNLITDPLSCRFDPAVLLCAGAENDSCLTAAQLAALRKIYAGPANPRTGQQIFPGFAVGSERQWAGLVANLNAAGLGRGYFANLTFEDPNWDYKTFNFDSHMAYADFKVGLLGNATDTDLSAARRQGVKIIQYHGWEDQTLQPAYSPEYYEAVVQQTGSLKKTQKFYRLFMVPGMRHCNPPGPGAGVFGQGTGQQPPVRDALHDVQVALEAWVEHGLAPRKLIGTKYTTDDAAASIIQFTRPLCPHPQVSRYVGGDPNSDASFACVGQPRNDGDDDDDEDDRD